MESSILSEVHDTSILRTGLSTDYAVISTSLASRIAAGLSTAPRAAGWSAATSCLDPLLPWAIGPGYWRNAPESGRSLREKSDRLQGVPFRVRQERVLGQRFRFTTRF